METKYSSDHTGISNPQIIASRSFSHWLKAEEISLVFTTYQTSRLLFLGVNPEGNFSGFERLFDRAMGLYATSERLYMSSKYQVWQLDNILKEEQYYNGYDKLYVPRIGYTTGDLDIHDLVVDNNDRIIFVSSLLNCLATVSHKNSCTPLWKPSFISEVINEDRCHLNGLAMVAGKPTYVTAISSANIINGWRDKRRDGGCLIDVPSNEIIMRGLSMPHSPRFYQGKLWLLNSGEGFFGVVDLDKGKFEPITFCPGYLRGLAFWKNWAIVGLSKPRDRTFLGLKLDENLFEQNVEPRCGLMIIDINTGNIVEWLRLEGVVTELYDVQILPGVKRPMALGFQTDEISRILTLDPIDNE
ncbi:TIGR03032 family protein [Okeania sp.]|uniref:TIGR03032 family protein n=1 Tax=Okeania sp. TaxID=3100323 RepID=UPI002B4B95C4|nr:TIGR03032 family protein [Okeania sp.]MEB3343168.1 TIGR03032 family protein [Okeania sp.]